jgi:hypothetical protein
MYGMVNNAVQELVCSKFGEDAWERIKTRAGVDVDVFVSNEAYDDKITYDLVAAASVELNIPANAILEAFGEHWILHTGRSGYGQLFNAVGKTLPEFLHNLPAFHTRVKLMLPNLQPPRFEVSDETPTSLVLHYHTHRAGLSSFVVGLIKGLGTMFNTPVTVTMQQAKGPSSDHDVFLLVWEAPQA